MTKRYKPLVDRLYWIIAIPTNILCISIVLIPSILSSGALFVSLGTLLFINYFLISPLFGYVELRENEIFIKYGLFLKRSIEYKKIRATIKQRK